MKLKLARNVSKTILVLRVVFILIVVYLVALTAIEYYVTKDYIAVKGEIIDLDRSREYKYYDGEYHRHETKTVQVKYSVNGENYTVNYNTLFFIGKKIGKSVIVHCDPNNPRLIRNPIDSTSFEVTVLVVSFLLLVLVVLFFGQESSNYGGFKQGSTVSEKEKNILTVALVFVMLFFGLQYVQKFYEEKDYIAVEGEITASYYDTGSNIVEISYNVDGESYTAEYERFTFLAGKKIGQAVTVYCDPNNPQLIGEKLDSIGFISLVTIEVISFLVLVVFIVWRIKKYASLKQKSNLLGKDKEL